MKKTALIVTLATVLGLGGCLLLKPDLSGTYKGELPCIDCDKIEARLTLNADNTYQYDSIYFKNGKEHAYRDKGNYSIDPNNPNLIRLEKASGNLAFAVSKEYAEICDPNGNTVKNSNNYKLLKVR